jgi:hypothetical protein
MEFRFVTGKLGSGKTLCAVGHAAKCLSRGKMIATNVDFYPENFANKYNDKTRIFRLPDHPCAADLRSLPVGNPTLELGLDGSYRPSANYDPDKNSLLLLDELAQFLNTRNYSSKDRLDMIQVLVLLRKMGWDAWFIVQHIDMVDKQLREGLAQETGYARDMSRIPIPVIGGLFRRVFGKALTFPKMHKVTFRDGYSLGGLIIESRTYSATRIKNLYNTAQTLSSDYKPSWAIKHDGVAGTHCLLTPWHFKGRFLPPPPTRLQRLNRSVCFFIFTVAAFLAPLMPDSWRKFGV